MMKNYIYRKTQDVIMDLTTVGVTISYQEMKIQIRLLFQYTLLCNRPNKRSIPNQFSKSWTKDALDNKNIANKSLIPGTSVKNYTMPVLYPDAIGNSNLKTSFVDCHPGLVSTYY